MNVLIVKHIEDVSLTKTGSAEIMTETTIKIESYTKRGIDLLENFFSGRSNKR